ncbi:hypothetical protein ANME2D_00744 [Candidatus Methanoperedens nitroreducens]|uniref:Uncharacterized protein n=1 Tax=Candidatus Methanoperedens nitratireducens TaxID=1392998 RepID=A0A062V3J9_9EURY|nr:hypothetical protein [Candidatus Methanoperedens nitroreducens]KCZ73671.1 hypothetical protein ANME2D_00744 [Candidatus Methanoperedens nitroreducens]MDJ1422369.1 hypothetical protein [Candidatus Methanoperedens sp.]
MLGCIEERSKGYNETGYPDRYFEHPKLGWYINKTYYIYETQGIDAAKAYYSHDSNVILERDSIKVRIIAKEEVNQTNLNVLTSLGINIITVSSTHIGAFVPIPKIRDLGEQEFIRVIYPDVRPRPQNS